MGTTYAKGIALCKAVPFSQKQFYRESQIKSTVNKYSGSLGNECHGGFGWCTTASTIVELLQVSTCSLFWGNSQEDG